MFTVALTSYGQTQVSNTVIIDGIILLLDQITDFASLSDISSYTITLDEEACGNLKNSIGNVLIQDLSDNEYQAKTILFYKNDSGKKILGGYSQTTPLIQKTSQILNLFMSFDFSAFTNGFLFSLIQAGNGVASHNTDGLIHIEDPNISSDNTYSVYNKAQVDTLLQDKQATLSAGNGISLSDNIVKTTGIPFGIVDNTSTSTSYTVTVPGIYKLEDGICCMIKNGVVTSASGFTLNVNGLGAKPCYSNMAAATRETTIFNANYTMLFVYDSTRIEGGAWVCYRGYYSDANSVAYQIRGNTHTLPTTGKFVRYRLLFTSADGTKFVPSNISTSTNATAKREVVQTPIDPFGEIVYYSTTAAVDVGASPGATYLWTQYAVTLGYSFNRTGAALVLTFPAPVYLKCAPQTNGSAIIDADNPYIQTLPNTADSKIYIFLGIATSATAIELLNNHPIYYHDGTGIKIWTGKDCYSKSEADIAFVPVARTVNSKALSSDITLNLDDVLDGSSRAIPTDTGDLTNNAGFITSASLPTVNDSTITIKKTASETGDSFTTNNATAKTINLGLHTVATSGNYNDLSNKPTIPTVNNAKLTIKKTSTDTGTEFTANASTNVTCNLDLATVATSGSYNDLSNKPTIPTVNNATLTINKGGTDDTGSKTFSANASSNVTINLGLATVASSGSYNDLSNKPTIPSLANTVASAQYNSTTGNIEFYNSSGTKLNTDISATPFTKDGMIDSISVITQQEVLGVKSITLDAWTDKMSTIKVVRDATGLGIADAKAIVESKLPVVIYTGNDADTVYTTSVLGSSSYNSEIHTFTYHSGIVDVKKLKFQYNADANKQDVIISTTDLCSDYVTINTSQTITGIKSFSTNILPETTLVTDLGSSQQRWNYVYTNNLHASGNVTARSFVKTNGTSSQFLKADGSVDSTTYLTSASLSDYVTTNTAQTITANKAFTGVTSFDSNSNCSIWTTASNNKLSFAIQNSTGTLSLFSHDKLTLSSNDSVIVSCYDNTLDDDTLINISNIASPHVTHIAVDNQLKVSWNNYTSETSSIISHNNSTLGTSSIELNLYNYDTAVEDYALSVVLNGSDSSYNNDATVTISSDYELILNSANNIHCTSLLFTADIFPEDSGYTLGSSNKPWSEVYADEFHGDLVGKLATPRYVNGMSFDGSSDILNYGYAVCSSSAGAQYKDITIPGVSLENDVPDGVMILVRFVNTNTYKLTGNSNCARIRINNNSTYTKRIRIGGNYVNNTPASSWYAGDCCLLVYNSSVGAFQILARQHAVADNGIDTNGNIITDTYAKSLRCCKRDGGDYSSSTGSPVDSSNNDQVNNNPVVIGIRNANGGLVGACGIAGLVAATLRGYSCNDYYTASNFPLQDSDISSPSINPVGCIRTLLLVRTGSGDAVQPGKCIPITNTALYTSVELQVLGSNIVINTNTASAISGTWATLIQIPQFTGASPTATESRLILATRVY